MREKACLSDVYHVGLRFVCQWHAVSISTRRRGMHNRAVVYGAVL